MFGAGDRYLCQETLGTWSESCKRMLRKTAPYGPPGMAIQVRPAYRRRYLYFSIACRSIWQLSSAPSPPVQSEFPDRDAKKELHTRVEDEPMFCMQLPWCAEVPMPRCADENPLS